MSDREKATGMVPVVTASSDRREVVVARSMGGRQVRTTFNFDGVLGSFSTQDDVFNATVRPLVDQVLSGYEATAFAYGQTGTGKTYTMEGDPEAVDGVGLMPRAAAAVLAALSDAKYSEHSVTVSYLEIYNEDLSDLLAPPHCQQKLDLMDTGRGVCCVGLSEIPVQTLGDITELVRTAQERKRMAETRINARSSRSHCIFTMKVRCRKRVVGGELESVGKLHLVDLAGSECAKKAAWGADELAQPMQRTTSGNDQERERRNINQSLLTLARVIAALRDNTGRIPYRDSKLTRILKDALGGNCKTVLIATISPALVAVEETISTLTYAEQANGIQNKPVASSLLRVTRDPLAGDLSGTSSCGRTSTDWAEAEMKIMYLTQEVEEAQSALARKYQEMQELVERAENAEQETEKMRSEVTHLQSSLSTSAAAHGRVTSSARALVSELNTACVASVAAREREEKELAGLRGQRFVEEQVIAGLQRQRQDLQSDVSGIQKELEAARAELLSTRSQIQEMRSSTEQRCGDALQAIVQLATSELNKIGQGVTESVDKACNQMDGVCGRLGCASESASAAEARCVGTGEKATETLSSWCKEFNTAHDKFYQLSTASRKALETSTEVAKEKIAECGNVAELAAANASWAGVRDHAKEEPVMKENSDRNIVIATMDKKMHIDNSGIQDVSRVALKELN